MQHSAACAPRVHHACTCCASSRRQGGPYILWCGKCGNGYTHAYLYMHVEPRQLQIYMGHVNDHECLSIYQQSISSRTPSFTVRAEVTYCRSKEWRWHGCRCSLSRPVGTISCTKPGCHTIGILPPLLARYHAKKNRQACLQQAPKSN